MKSAILEKVWITIAAIGVGISLFINNSHPFLKT